MASIARTALRGLSQAARKYRLPARPVCKLPTRNICTSLVCRCQAAPAPAAKDILVDLEKVKSDVAANKGVKYDDYPLRLPCPIQVLLDEQVFEDFYKETVNQPQNFEEAMVAYGITDPFELTNYCVAPGTKSFPRLVPTTEAKRMVGCMCVPGDPYLSYQFVHLGEQKRCDCGCWYRCMDYASFLLAQSEQVKAMHDAGIITASPATLLEAEIIYDVISKPECRARLEKWIEAGRH